MVSHIDTTCHFFDEHRGESLLTELFVDAEEVHFCHNHVDSVHSHVNRNRSDEAEKFLLLSASDSDVPILVIARGHESPLKEVDRVVKSEFTFCVFDVVECQQVIDLLSDSLVIQVHLAPLVSLWKR